MASALHSALDHDLHDNFDRIDWQAGPAAAKRVERLPLFVSEVIFYAAQEAIRNAARHGRGDDQRRPLHLSVRLDGDPDLKITISDDGVGGAGRGVQSADRDGGSGSGLLFHSTMLAVVGGALTVQERAGGGTEVVINGPEYGWETGQRT